MSMYISILYPIYQSIMISEARQTDPRTLLWTSQKNDKASNKPRLLFIDLPSWAQVAQVHSQQHEPG